MAPAAVKLQAAGALLTRRFSQAMAAHLQHEVDDEGGRVLHVRLDVRQHLAQRSGPAACTAKHCSVLGEEAHTPWHIIARRMYHWARYIVRHTQSTRGRLTLESPALFIDEHAQGQGGKTRDARKCPCASYLGRASAA